MIEVVLRKSQYKFLQNIRGEKNLFHFFLLGIIRRCKVYILFHYGVERFQSVLNKDESDYFIGKSNVCVSAKTRPRKKF